MTAQPDDPVERGAYEGPCSRATSLPRGFSPVSALTRQTRQWAFFNPRRGQLGRLPLPTSPVIRLFPQLRAATDPRLQLSSLLCRWHTRPRTIPGMRFSINSYPLGYGFFPDGPPAFWNSSRYRDEFFRDGGGGLQCRRQKTALLADVRRCPQMSHKISISSLVANIRNGTKKF